MSNVHRLGEYQVPGIVRYWPYIMLVWSYILLTLMALAEYYRGAGGQLARMGRVAFLGMMAVVMTAVVWWLLFKEGRREVFQAEWHNKSVVLYPRRGGAVSIPWSDVAYAVVPREPPHSERYRRALPPHLPKLRLVLVGNKRQYTAPLQYMVPLSWSKDCKAFLSALGSNASVKHADRDG